MNESDVSSLLSVGMHEAERGQESYAAECSKMTQDTSAIYTDHSNTSAFLEQYHVSGSQPLEELRFGDTQHFDLQSQRMVADSEEDSMPSSPDTSSTANYDISGMEQNLQHIYNAYDALVDKDGPIMLTPDYITCDENYHIEPRVTFSSDGIKIEYLDLDLDKMITFDWGLSKIISISCKWFQSAESALITLLADSEAEIGNSGPVRVQFSIEDLQWPRKQQNIWHLEARYVEIWKDIPSDELAPENWSIESSLSFPSHYFSSTDDFEDVIYPRGDPDAVSISKRDAELLLPETFVNDTIIDFYIKYLTTGIESTEKRRYHFFNSFFFRKLADLDKDQGRAPEGRAAFLRVRKWTRKINIFEKDFVFIPVNFSLHWSLIVVCYPGEVATSGDGPPELSTKLPCILHMDSLKGSHSGLKDIIQSYLWEEWKERHPESATDNSDKFLNLRFLSLKLPQQDNSFDCGLFLLHYVERFLMDAPSNFNPFKNDIFSSFLNDDWFPPAEASHKRSEIQKLIHEVVTGSVQNHPKLSGSNEQLVERHQNRNAEEPAGDFLAQSCSADQAELVCTVRDDAHGTERSTSICLNVSEEKLLSATGAMVDSGRVSMVAVQNLEESGVCLQENDTVYLSSQDEKNEPLVTELNITSCATDDGEVLKESSCGASYVQRAESLLLSLDDNQKISFQAEAEVQNIMVSNCCSVSYNSELITHQEYSLQKNTDDLGQECYRPSQDMDSLAMLDSTKDDIEPNSEMMCGENDGADPGENMGSVAQSDINKDVEVKREDCLAYPKTLENAIKDSVKEIDTTAGNISHSEQYVSSELTGGNANNGMAADISQLNVEKTDYDSAVSSSLNEGNTDQINADGEDAYKHLATSEAIHYKDSIVGAVPCKDATDGAIPCKDAMDGAVPCKDATDAAVPKEDDTAGTETQERIVPHEGDTSCTDDIFVQKNDVQVTTTETPHPDSLCEEKAVSGDRCIRKDDAHGTDAKRPLSDDMCEKDTPVTEKDNLHGTEAKKERHYKRRKVLAAESQKETSSSGV